MPLYSLYLVAVCLCIGNYGLGQNIDRPQKTPDHSPIYENTSASNREMTVLTIGAPTTNPPSQTTGILITGNLIQSSKTEGTIINSTSSTESTPQVSRHNVLTPSTQPDISPSPTQRYSSNPTESRNSLTNPSREENRTLSNRTAGPQEQENVQSSIHRSILPDPHILITPPINPPPQNTTWFPRRTPSTKQASRPTTRAGLTKSRTKHTSKTDAHNVATKKNTPPLLTNTIPTSTVCPTYTGTFLQLVFENNSQDLCRKEMDEIRKGIIKYAKEVTDLEFATHSVFVLNDCEICQGQNKTDATRTTTFEFCITTKKSCDVDATTNVWGKMDERKELDQLETYMLVKIVSMDLSPTTEKEAIKVNILLIVGLLSATFLILIFAIIVFRGKAKKSSVKDRFYFDGSKIQECPDTGGNVNESYCLDRVKDRELKHMSLLIPAINLGLDIDEDHKLENEFPSHLLSVNALKMYFTYKEAIDEEFKSLPYFRPLLKELPVGVGTKNRTAHVLPPLNTRIVLSSRIDSNGYINANQIKGYQSSNVSYIATQAPLSNTCADFWHMVWEQQSRVIVMLCTSDEIGKNFQQYWPKNHGMEGALLFGDILVSLEGVTSSEHQTVSNLVVKDIERNLCRPISHYWFSSWPTQGVPSSPADITGLLLHVRESITENQGPMVVHCSDGAGRTGALITIDISMHELEDTTHVDVPRTTCMVRKDRGAGIENALQYNYIYQALYDYSQRLSRANQQVGW